MVGAVATYRPGEGRFGGAVAVEEGTTNLHTKAFASSWAGISPPNATVEDIEVDGFTWAKRYSSDGQLSGNIYNIVSIPCNPSQTYTFSVWVRRVSGSITGECYMYLRTDADTNNIARLDLNDDMLPIGQWRRFSITGTTQATATQFTRASFLVNRVNAVVLEIADWQLEAKPFATSFVDGTRAAGQLRYPWNWFKTPFTWAFWLRPGRNRSDYSVRTQLLRAMQNVNDYISVEFRADYAHKPFAFVFWQSGVWHQYELNVNFSAGEWLFVALAFDGATGTLYVGRAGTLYSVRGTPTVLVGGPGDLLVNPSLLDFLFDELLILPYAASEEEIRSWYEADGPLPPHPDALLQWDWQAVRPATMVAL